ncbi:hypothetical protein BOTBODRAFT_418383 [Botryobasidium botryosum FD-172 SS1]|uniref:Uncharacterized protein n=1 Tax=Botryobasidium botryosum (strain FD-172 SS1) TaxID=930990 RepID=A0A067MK26_BOTB1|nr:hypothetical protein BOTBODRAFT_418383 [Botryobasidium botryosum FD-172 SS1]
MEVPGWPRSQASVAESSFKDSPNLPCPPSSSGLHTNTFRSRTMPEIKSPSKGTNSQSRRIVAHVGSRPVVSKFNLYTKNSSPLEEKEASPENAVGLPPPANEITLPTSVSMSLLISGRSPGTPRRRQRPRKIN